MKTLAKNYLLVALMLGTLITYGNEKTNTTSANKVTVAYKEVKKGHVLSIKNNEYITIYSLKIDQNGNFTKTLDLSNLKEGNYSTELEKDSKIIVKYFTVNKGTVTFENEKTVFKPVIRKENDLVLISKLEFNKEPLKVKLFYQNEVIVNETVEDESKILNRVYKLSKDKSGEYTVIIKTDHRTFTKNFTI
ncbi:hypothetical protein [uncultured Polaribacter sp.]|uniref:hypothetical protein n=1 Tax=uncultured Polaribacter sp. TaxID=174711 RepID=UPI002634EC27|nr:hypothetical protein [uncultured Polaribacter sp.]